MGLKVTSVITWSLVLGRGYHRWVWLAVHLGLVQLLLSGGSLFGTLVNPTHEMIVVCVWVALGEL